MFDAPGRWGMLQIFENHLLTIEKLTKIPRKKKNNWWMKKYKKKYSVTVPDDQVYIFGDNLFCHPETAIQIRKLYQKAKDYTQKSLESAFLSDNWNTFINKGN